MDQVQTLLIDVPQDLSELSEAHASVFSECIDAAAELASHYKSQIILFSHVYAAGASLDTWLQGTVLHNAREELVDAQQARLEALGAPLVARGFDVRHVAVWSKHLDDALEQIFDDNLPDLVIQPSRHHLFAAAMIRQPSEWRMIRLPKVPVLLQQKTGSLSGRVLLALDVGEVEISQEVNQNIIRQVKKWCAATQSELHLLNAYPSAADLMAFAPAEWTIPQIQSTLEEQHKDRLRSLAEETGIDPTCIHVGEGPVAQVIGEFTERLGISLVALTSHCRRGVSGFFVGNTAETVLEQTKLNLLVLKPTYE